MQKKIIGTGVLVLGMLLVTAEARHTDDAGPSRVLEVSVTEVRHGKTTIITSSYAWVAVPSPAAIEGAGRDRPCSN
jgi:hypothetical protein